MDKIASKLLKIKAVFLNTDKLFTWASGIKSPIYTDNRLIISHVKIRKYIESALAAAIKKYYSSVKAIVGTSTAGIPHAAFVSQILNLPMAYVRNKTKSHGRSKMIEGDIKPNTPVVVIEDLLSTGNSCLEVVKILRKNRIKVLGVISIFSYQTQKCLTNFKLAKCKCISLCTLDELLLTAIKEKYIKPDKAKLITNFRDSLSY